ncbi:hypothetical protein SADUNF_Sadunf12G0071100 [Salix dunnii]|uniref:Uncharacterized protein n=1 Tax=Salix dunnii TaxID=1413687 RepID=A0A835JNI1_9ROSI|nr:hypothetical protein SADUNF_Sadunf12G0071100 [Salix dunnii]
MKSKGTNVYRLPWWIQGLTKVLGIANVLGSIFTVLSGPSHYIINAQFNNFKKYKNISIIEAGASMRMKFFMLSFYFHHLYICEEENKRILPGYDDGPHFLSYCLFASKARLSVEFFLTIY